MFERRALHIVVATDGPRVEVEQRYLAAVSDAVSASLQGSGRSAPIIYGIPDGGDEGGTIRSMIVQGGDEGATIRTLIEAGDVAVVDLTHGAGATPPPREPDLALDAPVRRVFAFVDRETPGSIARVAAEFARSPAAELFVIEVGDEG
jgi:hypothetical protein